jgi:uncharacterized Zn-binding protein involved in type VI secretion
MGRPAAVQGSQVIGVDTHIVLVPSPGGPVPTPLPHPFAGMLDGGLVGAVKIGGQPAGVVGSTARNAPPHIPTPPGTSFATPPANLGTVKAGSATVTIAGQAAARLGDPVETCNDPADAPVGQLVATGSVLIGG